MKLFYIGICLCLFPGSLQAMKFDDEGVSKQWKAGQSVGARSKCFRPIFSEELNSEFVCWFNAKNAGTAFIVKNMPIESSLTPQKPAMQLVEDSTKEKDFSHLLRHKKADSAVNSPSLKVVESEESFPTVLCCLKKKNGESLDISLEEIKNLIDKGKIGKTYTFNLKKNGQITKCAVFHEKAEKPQPQCQKKKGFKFWNLFSKNTKNKAEKISSWKYSLGIQ